MYKDFNLETYWSSKFTGSPAIALSGVVAHNIANGKRECLLDKVTVNFTNIPDHVVDHLLKVGEIFLASGSFTIGDRELGKYVEHLDGTLDAIEGTHHSRFFFASWAWNHVCS